MRLLTTAHEIYMSIISNPSARSQNIEKGLFDRAETCEGLFEQIKVHALKTAAITAIVALPVLAIVNTAIGSSGISDSVSLSSNYSITSNVGGNSACTENFVLGFVSALVTQSFWPALAGLAGCVSFSAAEPVHLTQQSAEFITSTRLIWSGFAEIEFCEIYNMKQEERTQSIHRLQNAAFSNKDLPSEDLKWLTEHPITERELQLRASLEEQFKPLSIDILQLHYTYFNGRQNDQDLESDCSKMANRLIVNQLGDEIIRKGFEPQVPKN